MKREEKVVPNESISMELIRYATKRELSLLATIRIFAVVVVLSLICLIGCLVYIVM